EAITATFKLYSRLQSTSEVINSPSLYGFSVMDVLNINEAHGAVETINGRIFNTSILRKLQLYPAQAGKLMIDEMQLQNVIEFDDSLTNRKIKVEKLLASNPVEITVKPLPLTQPAGYTGAVGQFAITADLPNPKFEANTPGKLIVTIDGKGNFIQFGPPAIQWPKGFDVFDPVVSDVLDKNTIPAEGRRKYTFSFTTNQAGSFTIPPVGFSFFDPALRKYREVKSDLLKLEILPATSNKTIKEEKSANQPGTSRWIIFLTILIVLALAAVFFLRRRKQESIQTAIVQPTNYMQRLNEIASQRLSAKSFCFEIQKLSKAVIKEYNLNPEQKQELEVIQRDCQLLIYSDIDSEGKQEELQKKVENLFRQLNA
ncbi:MAG TPA: BatD family protein, partial [Flavisolibacter sp.]|nr:BatD family protein [Flavisolibacter sp.]